MTNKDAAQIVEDIKAHARDEGSCNWILKVDQLVLRCTWAPNMSYGRYQEPAPGCEEFQWTWAVWSRRESFTGPAHVQPAERGWHPGLSQQDAQALLGGEPWANVRARLQARGQELASRFSKP